MARSKWKKRNDTALRSGVLGGKEEGDRNNVFSFLTLKLLLGFEQNLRARTCGRAEHFCCFRSMPFISFYSSRPRAQFGSAQFGSAQCSSAQSQSGTQNKRCVGCDWIGSFLKSLARCSVFVLVRRGVVEEECAKVARRTDF